jgi:hypothetical protein
MKYILTLTTRRVMTRAEWEGYKHVMIAAGGPLDAAEYVALEQTGTAVSRQRVRPDEIVSTHYTLEMAP